MDNFWIPYAHRVPSVCYSGMKMKYTCTRFFLLIFGLLVWLSAARPVFSVSCTGALAVSVSTNKQSPVSTITLPASQTTRYYLHVSTNGTACSTAFDVQAYSCDLGNTSCSPPVVITPWSTYRSDTQGIARIDVDTPLAPNKIYYGKYRPSGTTLPWSNQITIQTASGPLSVNNNISPYIIFEPGYAWEYTTTNFRKNKTGTTRIQIEQLVRMCNLNMKPWRFTKSDIDLYWDPSRSRDLRWFAVSPDSSFSQFPNFNNFIWVFGHKVYDRLSTYPLRDIFVGEMGAWAFYQSTSGRVPGYNLTKKTVPSDWVYIDKADGESANTPVYFGRDSCNVLSQNTSSPTSWKLRTEKLSSLTVGGRTFNDVVRIDYYEGGAPINTSGLLRESWYFARNIGLVQILIDTYNNYASDGSASCSQDADCWADTIQNPWAKLVLSKYWQNPTLTVAVSRDNSTYGSATTTTKNIGYYLKIENTAYSGYLEARAADGTGLKWLWAQSGLVFVPPSLLNGFSNGAYPAKFRIWIPNEQYPNETRVGTNTIPWSNEITVNLVSALTTPTSTPSPIPGDVTGDRRVNVADIVKLLTQWKNPYTIFDYALSIANYGRVN